MRALWMQLHTCVTHMPSEQTFPNPPVTIGIDVDEQIQLRWRLRCRSRLSHQNGTLSVTGASKLPACLGASSLGENAKEKNLPDLPSLSHALIL
jgi:hypothetical protein